MLICCRTKENISKTYKKLKQWSIRKANRIKESDICLDWRINIQIVAIQRSLIDFNSIEIITVPWELNPVKENDENRDKILIDKSSEKVKIRFRVFALLLKDQGISRN